MRVRNLGSLVVERDGDLIEMGASRQAALLARLAMEPQRQVPASALVAAAWGSGADTTPASLDSQLWRLRNRLDPGRGRSTSVLVRDGSGYRLQIDPVQVDSGYFDQLVSDIEQELSGRSSAATVLPLVDRALALWRGRPFEPISDHVDVMPDVARLTERKEQLQERRVELLMRCGRAEAALADSLALVAAAPYRERLWALRIRALADLGRIDEALAAYRAARDVLRDQLGLDPGEQLQKLQADILAGAVPRAAVHVAPTLDKTPTELHHGADGNGVRERHERPVVQLPRVASELVGRRRDQQRLSVLLAEKSLVTITGPGGCGKTSLAVHMGGFVSDAFPGGIWFVDLTTVGDDADVADTVAATIGLTAAPAGTGLQRLHEFGRTSAALIILDNCEHVLLGAAECAAVITGETNAAKVLCTSREPLTVDGEVVWALAPLSLLPTDESSPIDSVPAVQLFLQRAASAAPDLTFSDEDREIVATICRAVDGLPLAIELAAARVRMFSLAEIEGQVTNDPSRLGRLSRTRNDHHTNLYQAIEWSYRLLPAELQTLHRRLSVLPGAFTLAAARALTQDLPHLDVIQAAATLVNQSMLTVQRRGRVTTFVQLETIRAHARRRLEESSEQYEAASWRDHWVSALLARRPSLARAAIGAWYDEVEADYPTVQAAIQAAVGGSGAAHLVGLGSGLAFFWYFRSRSVEGRGWLAKAITSGHLTPGGVDEVLTQLRLAGAELVTFRPELARPSLDTVLERSSAGGSGDAVEIGEALMSVAGGAWACQAFDLLDAVDATLGRLANDSRNTDLQLFARAIHCVASRPERFTDQLLVELAELYDEATAEDNIIVAWFAALKSSVLAPTAAETLEWARRVIELHHRLGAGGSRPFLETLSNTFAVAGDYRTAVPIYAATAELARQTGTPWPEHPHTRATFEQVRRTMNDDEFEQLWRSGSELSLHDLAS